MNTLNENLDKLFRDVDHMEDILADDTLDEPRLLLLLGVTKRVRRTSSIITRELAILRDELQPERHKP